MCSPCCDAQPFPSPLRRGEHQTEGSSMRPYHVAIVGSGPSGFFAAASLLKAADASEDIDVAVDMLEMLPTPWGLVRSGVAPDHPKIKSISKQFEKTAEDPRFRFSAMWWWASTSAQPNSPSATTP